MRGGHLWRHHTIHHNGSLGGVRHEDAPLNNKLDGDDAGSPARQRVCLGYGGV